MKNRFKKIKSKKKQIVIGSIVLISLAIGGFVVVKNKTNGTDIEEEMGVAPEMYTVPGKEKIFVSGKIVPAQSKDLSIDAEKGEVDQIKVEDGAKVDKGKALFTCKNESAISDINGLKEDLSKKEKEKQNSQDEEMKKSIEEEISDINKQISKLEKTAYTTVYAPFTGKVYLNDQTSDGDQQPTSLMTIEAEGFYIKGQASEQDLAKISLNQEVEILVFSTKEKFIGKITAIGERPSTNQSDDMMANQNMSYYDIKISFNDGQDLSKVKNGFHVQTTIEAKNQEIKIPKTAIKPEDGKTFVFKVIDGIIYKQEVKLGETTDEYAVINEGILEEDEIIRYAQDENIKDGERIYQGGETSTEGEAEIVE